MMLVYVKFTYNIMFLFVVLSRRPFRFALLPKLYNFKQERTVG